MYVNPSARDTFASLLANRSRILVLGAAGWFGRTLVDLLTGLDANLMLIGSAETRARFGHQEFGVLGWNAAKVEQFSPDVVFDFAFLLANRMKTMDRNQYVATNRLLVSRAEWLLSLESVNDFYTVSSGASLAYSGRQVEPDVAEYGRLKGEAEERLTQEAVSQRKRLRIIRAWSVSGGHVPRPQDYLFSHMILGAIRTGRIEIQASGPLFRRYCAIEDLLTLALANPDDQTVSVIESGGQLVEARELATAIQSLVPGSEIVERVRDRLDGPADAYHSNGADWELRLSQSALAPLSLGEQIQAVTRALRAREAESSPPGSPI